QVERRNSPLTASSPTWRNGFFLNVDGFAEEWEESTFDFKLEGGKTQKTAPVPRVVAKLKRRSGIATEEFEFVKAATGRTPKVTLPAPSVMHFFRGDGVVDRAIYSDVREYMADVSAIYREEIADLAALGCTYIQFDDVALPILCDPEIKAMVGARGEDGDALVDLYIDAMNDALRDRPDGVAICMHMCRGNVGAGMASGGYEPIAERMFNRLQVDGMFLEYDTERAGDFSPLRFAPPHLRIALGLVSTKVREVEDQDTLKRRIEEASKYVDLDQLALCPQCGFASGFKTARLSLDDEERKLANMVEVARQVWG
ncbi:MAG: hypothetical protein RLT05_15830, partial [Bauldia litoralis]